MAGSDFSSWPPLRAWGNHPLAHSERMARRKLVGSAHKAIFSPFPRFHAVTITCHQSQTNNAGGQSFIDRTILSKELESFFKRIDRKVYRNAAIRHNKRLRRFCVIEGGSGTGKHLHAHFLIEWPHDRMTDERKSSWWGFQNLVVSEWRRSPWARSNLRYDPGPDEWAALDYMTKCGLDAVDWANTYLGEEFESISRSIRG